MTKTFKYISIFLILAILLLNINYSFATEEDLSEAPLLTTSEGVEENNIIEEDVNDNNPLSVWSLSSDTNVSNINSYEQANLSLNNILCIILISIGLLLILLSIALLIRVK